MNCYNFVLRLHGRVRSRSRHPSFHQNGLLYALITQFLSVDLEDIHAETEIVDKSKADPLVKMIAVSKGLFTIVEGCVRAGKMLPVFELEIRTCSYVVCRLVTYFLWWHKLYSIGKHIVLKQLEYAVDPPSEDADSMPLVGIESTPKFRSVEKSYTTDAFIYAFLAGSIVGAITSQPGMFSLSTQKGNHSCPLILTTAPYFFVIPLALKPSQGPQSREKVVLSGDLSHIIWFWNGSRGCTRTLLLPFLY